MQSVSLAVEHLLKDILELNDDEITNITQLKYTSWNKLTRQLRLTQIDHELKNKDMPMSVYKGMKDWLFYYHKYYPAQDSILRLDSSIYDDEDMDNLELEYRRKVLPHTVPPSQSQSTMPPLTASSTSRTPPSPTQPPSPSPSTLPSTPNQSTTQPSSIAIIHSIYNNSPDKSITSPVIHTASAPSDTSSIDTTTVDAFDNSFNNGSDKSITTPVIHTASAPSDTSSVDTTTADAFNNGFNNGYEAACDNLNGSPDIAYDAPPPNIHNNTYHHNVSNTYDSCPSAGYDDAPHDNYDDNYEFADEWSNTYEEDIDPEPPPYW